MLVLDNIYNYVCVCMCVCVRACMRACVRARVCVCVCGIASIVWAVNQPAEFKSDFSPLLYING